jgi:hypothetical protein
MAKNTTQISLIKHRRGKLSELPTQLNEGEFGLALDTNQLFIGNPENDELSQRIEENIFPYGNIEVLTEFTDNLNKIKYTYKSNTDVTARLPIVIYGSNANPILPANSSIILNSDEIYFKNNSSLQTIVETINEESTEVNAFVGLISNSTEIFIEDGTVGTTSNVSLLGFGEDSFYSQTSETLPQRTLQSTLDDYCSIKSFGVKGNGTTDDSEAIFNAIISINKAGEEPQFYRTIYIPAGIYNISTKPVPLPTGTHLKGDGIGRTVIKNKDLSECLVMVMDDNYNVANATSFGKDSKIISNIIVEDLTFDGSENDSQILSLGSVENVLFKNVEFIGTDLTTLINISNSTYNNSSLHIVFENCVFDNCYHALTSSTNVEHLVISHCLFKDCNHEAIIFNKSTNKIINSIIDGNDFVNCGTGSYLIISLSENCEYVSVINNKFEDNVANKISPIEAYSSTSDKTFTDILDATTDTKKLLQFKFTQPVWEYIDYLMNPNGQYILKSEYGTTIINGEEKASDLTNGLILTQGDATNGNTVSLKSSLDYGDISISGNAYGSVHLGSANETSLEEYNEYYNYHEDDIIISYDSVNPGIYRCISPCTGIGITNEDYWEYVGSFDPSIILHHQLDVNENVITNTGTSGDIEFKIDGSGIMKVTTESDGDTDGATVYANNIASTTNAIATVAYVNKAASSTIINEFNYNTLIADPVNKFDLITFDPNIYGDVVNIDKISINVRVPFYPIQDRIADAQTWQPYSKYYKGDIVYSADEGIYMICLDDHISGETTDNGDNADNYWDEVKVSGTCLDGSTTNFNDVKYISIIATNDTENPARLLFNKNEIDITKRDIHSTYYPDWTANKAYKVDDKVSYQNRYWKCLKAHTSSEATDLHDSSLWTIISEEGFNYIYDFDREITPIDFKTEVELDGESLETTKVYNYSGYRLYMEMFDENMNLVPIAKHVEGQEDDDISYFMQLCPTGYMTISIHYIRGEK